ncbi:P-loop containing nucleoside triphosphate hydrolase protein [Crassisporium funariophilum]|nr:P-loop containing nucleoside triphosphate hydrolase protein [Crassisporium funariophilum]
MSALIPAAVCGHGQTAPRMPAIYSRPPLGTRHKAKRANFLAKLDALQKELKSLPELIKARFKKWTAGARDFQLSCMRAQVLKQDVLLQAATGSGKTGIAAGPHLLLSNKGKVTFVVLPLLALEDEQVETFQNEFGLKAVAINGSNGGCSPSTLAVTLPITLAELIDIIDCQKVVAAGWQIVILSPEMLMLRKFVDGVLRKPEFGPRCLSVFIDEAHCISHWGASFCKAYSSIGVVRAFLPRNTPIVAVTATLTPLVHQDLVSKLQFDQNAYLFVNMGNDRANVSQVVRAMQHPANSFCDLEFIIPAKISSHDNIAKAFLYSDDIKTGALIVDHLGGRIDAKYRHLGLVRPYNATMSKSYRTRVMKLFRDGKVRILVCTDAAGMGCDIPDIDIVVQWKAPKNVSSWVQRAGRAARASGRQGLAVMIVEKPAFEIATMRPSPTASHSSKYQGPTMSKHGIQYAIAHGQKRGMYGGAHDEVVVVDETFITSEILCDAPGEGIYLYIQTTSCRRLLLQQIFCNKPSTIDKTHCCDLCNPKLFDKVRPSQPEQASRQQAVKRIVAVDSVRMSLYGWRREVKAKHWPWSTWCAQAILDDNACELLASVGPFETQAFLLSVFGAGWEWWNKLGTDLFSFLHNLDIPPLPKRHSRGKKRHLSPSKRAQTAKASTSASTQRRRTKEVEPLVFAPMKYDGFFAQLGSLSK